MDRGRKRPETADQLPADKRACSSSRPGSSSSSNPPPLPTLPVPVLTSEPADCDMESSSSGRSDRAGADSAYGSCDSDDDPDHLRSAGGFDDPVRCGATKGKFQKIVSSLGDDAGPDAQLAALTELCEILSFCMEDSLFQFPIDAAVPQLVRLAGLESNPDIMLLSIRSLTYICDVMPRSAEALVRHGTVPVLCARLLAIEYLDVAEQCLQALEKISRKQPVPCLQAGTIMAVLGYIDFFSPSIQRVALSTVANVCKKLPLDCSSLVMESLPNLCNLLQYEDRKLVETVVTCLIRIADCFSNSSELMDELCMHGVINKLLHLVAADGRMSLSQTTYVGLIGLLTKLATSSFLAVRTLFELNISNTLKGILMTSDLSHSTPYSPFQDVQPNQVHEVLKLLNQLIPPVARDGEDIQLVLTKEKILTDEPKFLQQFSADILPVAIKVVNSGANLYVCYGCVSFINNVVYFSTPDMLLDLLTNTNISSFLAGLLTRKDRHVLTSTLKIIEILMQKLPGVFSTSFVKEGVVYAIDALLVLDNCSQSIVQESHHSDNQMAVRDASRCLCYAFSSQRSPSAETKSCRLGKDAIITLAKHIKATYFTNESMSSEMGLTEILQKLKTYCAVLNDNVDRSLTNETCAETEEYLCHMLDQVMRELSGGDTMSTFEFIESGIVKSLAHYLSNGRYIQGTGGNNLSSSHCLAVLTRFETFASISLSDAGHSWEDMVLTVLVRKLQSALSSFDNFPIISSHLSRPRNVLADIPFRRSTVQPCLRVRFVREEGEADLCNHNDILTVEISSSLDAIEEYLWPKLCGNKNENHAESPRKDIIKTADFTSGSKCSEERVHQEADANIMQHLSVSTLSEVRIIQERQILLVDTSAKLRELMTERTSIPTAVGEGQAGDRSGSASSGKQDDQPKLIFSLEGKQLDRSITLYQAILQDRINIEPDMIVGPKFWNDVYKVTYKRTDPRTSFTQTPYDASQLSHFFDKIGFPWHKISFFSSLLLGELPCKLDKSYPPYDILFMLKVLEGLNRFSFHLLTNEKSIAFAQGRIGSIDDLKVVVSTVPQAEFISNKLTDKLEQQMRDPLVVTNGSMPLWCSQLMATCPFLFSFEARWNYFRLTAFGSSKIQQNYIQHTNSSDTDSATDRRSQSSWFYRKKFKVDRSNILESAEKMMATLARSKAVIDVEYDEEVGTGLGPTMEFFTLASHEFQKIGMGMWRGDGNLSIQPAGTVNGGCAFVVAPFGLFPRPWSVETCIPNGIQCSDVIKRFFLLGQLVGKAIKDGRILDMPFSRAFYKVILEQELSIYDIQSFDPELGRTLLEFQALASRKNYLGSTSISSQGDASSLCFRGARVEDLCLEFILPGYSDYVLNGSDPKMVNIDNLKEYVTLVVNATVRDGISRQIEAFKSGFNEVFPLKNLHIFTEDELERLLCGERDTWDFSELLDHIKFDHGYTASSPSVINLLEIIQEFKCDERRAFLQFVTGAPRLPPGGLAALNPKMTIVRKHCGDNPDMDLPSVMTCANYLKLPSYSSKERMRQRLLYAITEGQGSFHLS